ncbi:MAG: hypothetical protein Q9187_002516 [Circinaria calcarea]
MPRHLIPNKSGVHRAACISLYRALLRQGPKLHLDSRQLFSFNHIVRENFSKHVKICSPRDIRNALGLGYETLKALVSSNGAQLSRLSCALTHFQELRSSNTPSAAAPQTSAIVKKKVPHQLIIKARPNTPSVLSRPFLSLSGPRHVPKLVSANGIPFLRFKKPQSPYLSRIIRDKVKQHSRRFDHLYDLEHQIVLAKDEDHWDKILDETCGLRRETENGDDVRFTSWATVVQHARAIVSWKLREETLNNAETARKMYSIIEQEKTLAAREQDQGKKAAE